MDRTTSARSATTIPAPRLSPEVLAYVEASERMRAALEEMRLAAHALGSRAPAGVAL